MKVTNIVYNLFKENTMIASREGSRACVIVDPGFSNKSEEESFFRHIEDGGFIPEAILLTHAHADHVSGAGSIQKIYGIPAYMSEADEIVLEETINLLPKLGLDVPDTDFKRTYIKDGEIIVAAGMEFKVITTPGHTPGCVCYHAEADSAIFTGDTLFAGTIGRTDLKYGEFDDEIRSIMEKLIFLDPRTVIYPGHGPSSTIGVERSSNPFLEPFNEPEE